MKSVIDKFFDPPKKKRKLRRLLKDEEISHLCHLMDGQKDMIRLICDKSVRYCLEDLHSGITPSSKTGDYSDVKVVSPYGEILWKDLSRISDKEMRLLMLSMENYIHNMFSTVIPKMIELNSEYNSKSPAHKKIKELYKNGVSWDLKEKPKWL
jgi:hypothetical protein